MICNNEEGEKSHFISKLHHFQRPYIPRIDLQDYKEYLGIHFTSDAQAQDQADSCMAASSVDFEQ